MDFKTLRELIIYKDTVENVKRAVKVLKQDNAKIQRPMDYYAEMIKSDKQVLKIQKRLQETKEMHVKTEKKREQRIQKKFQKKWKHEKNLKKSKDRKQNIEKINQWKSDLRSKGEKAKDLDQY